MSNWREKGLACGLLVLRVLAGAGIAYHGYGKVFGGHMDRFAAGVAAMGLPLPGFFAWAAALSELVGGICLALGLGTRMAALLILATMLVAAFGKHAGDPFGKRELALMYGTAALTLLLTGPGKMALDTLLGGWLFWRRKTERK